jgi:hypothetical protein
MPLTVPSIDDRRFQDLRDEGLRRIPVHNPEWTNFNKSDPGVTLIEVFAFLTESLLYRANQIPDRNRRKFLKLLGIPLQSASSAKGLVSFGNDRGPLENRTLAAGFEVRAGEIPFRLEQGLDVLPVEGHVFFKRVVKNPSATVLSYYEQLYASFLDSSMPANARLYESVPLVGAEGIDLSLDAVDGSFWLALAARKSDVAGLTDERLEAKLESVREVIAARTLTLGVVPWLANAERHLSPGGKSVAEQGTQLRCHIPLVPEGGDLPAAANERVPRYLPLAVNGTDVLSRPGTVQITLPSKSGLTLWSNLDPLEAGVGDFPPAIEDTNLQQRVVTWLRFSVPGSTRARILWTGMNAAMIAQRAHITGERLPDGTGAPDQSAKLARSPVLPDSVRLFVTRPGEKADEWFSIDDLANAGAEVPVSDHRVPPGAPRMKPNPSRVFYLDAEAGEIRFGDGARGTRPPLGATLVADYDYSEGREGNVNAGAIKTGPSLPPGYSVTNPVETWGGADEESVDEGEKQVQRWLQHRDRLVTAEDFELITWRTPGIELGRVDVIAAASPELGDNEPGDAPGAVTLMLIPRRDAEQPDAPRPDRLFLDSVCAWLDPRRLVTTEIFLRGPTYKDIWISAGIDVASERSIAEVRQAVENALRKALAPLPPSGASSGPEPLMPVFTKPSSTIERGWPLRKPVVALELAAIAARVPGVSAVNTMLLAGTDDTDATPSVSMRGLDLPRVAGIMVTIGSAIPLSELRGATSPDTGAAGFLPLPFVPEEC